MKIIFRIILALIAASLLVAYLISRQSSPIPEQSVQEDTSLSTDKPQITSTNPSPLEEGTTISPSQIIELTFNLPLENIGELKHELQPKADYKIELSQDRKTVKLIPQPIFTVGTTYTLTIKPDSKFNESPGNESTKKILQNDITLRFKTPEYRGI